MSPATFQVWTPFTHRLMTFQVKAGVAADAYELKLKDFGISYTRTTERRP